MSITTPAMMVIAVLVIAVSVVAAVLLRCLATIHGLPKAARSNAGRNTRFNRVESAGGPTRQRISHNRLQNSTDQSDQAFPSELPGLSPLVRHWPKDHYAKQSTQPINRGFDIGNSIFDVACGLLADMYRTFSIDAIHMVFAKSCETAGEFEGNLLLAECSTFLIPRNRSVLLPELRSAWFMVPTTATRPAPARPQVAPSVHSAAESAELRESDSGIADPVQESISRLSSTDIRKMNRQDLVDVIRLSRMTWKTGERFTVEFLQYQDLATLHRLAFLAKQSCQRSAVARKTGTGNSGVWQKRPR